MTAPDEGGGRRHGPEAVLVLGDGEAGDALRDLRRRLPPLLDSGAGTLVLDLSRTSELSSATVAAILWTNRRCRARGTEVVLRRPSRRSIELLRRCGLDGAILVDASAAGRGAVRDPSPARGRPW